MGQQQKISARQYAAKMVEVAYYEVMPNKETITNVLEALIKEYANQQTKHLTEQLSLKDFELKASDHALADLQSQLTISDAKVKLNYNNAVEFENQLAEKGKELSEVKSKFSDFYCHDELVRNAAEDYSVPKCKTQCYKFKL